MVFNPIAPDPGAIISNIISSSLLILTLLEIALPSWPRLPVIFAKVLIVPCSIVSPKLDLNMLDMLDTLPDILPDILPITGAGLTLMSRTTLPDMDATVSDALGSCVMYIPNGALNLVFPRPTVSGVVSSDIATTNTLLDEPVYPRGPAADPVYPLSVLALPVYPAPTLPVYPGEPTLP